jgi:pimeloyl-ACP methyl ester carboxylesterase
MRRLAYEMNRLALDHGARKLGKRLADTGTPAAERLDALLAPLLVIVGVHDTPYLRAAADQMADHIPSARKVVMEDAAHLANMDHPGEFRQAVEEFLQDLA